MIVFIHAVELAQWSHHIHRHFCQRHHLTHIETYDQVQPDKCTPTILYCVKVSRLILWIKQRQWAGGESEPPYESLLISPPHLFAAQYSFTKSSSCMPYFSKK